MKNKGVALLVVDDPRFLEQNRQILEADGYTVYTAKTIPDARAILENLRPDMILLDSGLSDRDNDVFYEEIEKQETIYIYHLICQRYGLR